MTASQPDQRRDALEIWQAGVDAVDSRRLVECHILVDSESIHFGALAFPLAALGKIAVVGAGKAGVGMAAGFETAVGSSLLDERVSGWVNVPADCVRDLHRIHLHAARPVGVNEPTWEGVQGTEEILRIVAELNPQDLCVVLLSGGGSALMPSPVPEISLQDKQQVTRFLSKAGATIFELNTVRQQLSRVKGGRLAGKCGAGNLVALIISDVIGDPLEIIASGPTVVSDSTPKDALKILRKFAQTPSDVPAAVWDYLQKKTKEPPQQMEFRSVVYNQIIGNNRVALEAAQQHADALGYRTLSLGSDNPGEARDVGRELAQLARSIRDGEQAWKPPVCILSGGEPVVHLTATDRLRKGGRNQELVLAAAWELWNDGMRNITILSGGTDGEDGPTDAAGAVADAQLIRTANSRSCEPEEFLAINNSYPFFEQCDALIKTGWTHTNVMDLRVVLIGTR